MDAKILGRTRFGRSYAVNAYYMEELCVTAGGKPHLPSVYAHRSGVCTRGSPERYLQGVADRARTKRKGTGSDPQYCSRLERGAKMRSWTAPACLNFNFDTRYFIDYWTKHQRRRRAA